MQCNVFNIIKLMRMQIVNSNWEKVNWCTLGFFFGLIEWMNAESVLNEQKYQQDK